jgi:circadian clock protein KaiC
MQRRRHPQNLAPAAKNGHDKSAIERGPSTLDAREPLTSRDGLAKARTGISGFDEITMGGLPRGRASLFCGAAGCGKTLFAVEFLVHGATRFDEPGVFVAFEETTRELEENTEALGFDLRGLIKAKKLVVEHVTVERGTLLETGQFDLEGLFIRLGYAIDSIGAKRVVLDTLEILLAGLPNPAVLRAEIHRLFRWLKDRGVTAIVTAEAGSTSLTRDGLEEYVSDCVVALDNRVVDQVSTRRLRVTKYRGSMHGTDEYPFLIMDNGISVLPLSSLGLDHQASTDHVPTGVKALDAMFGGRGFYCGSTVLISGSAGSGKTTLASHFAKANSQGESRCLYFAFEESSAQIIRNLRSIGLDLEPEHAAGSLLFHSCRPTTHSLELHLVEMHRLIADFRPTVVIVDPISSLTSAAPTSAVRSMLTRLIDHLKTRQATALFTSFTPGSAPTLEMTDIGVSSLVDTWMIVRDLETDGERTRGLTILKSRGMAHSNQVREFRMTAQGVELIDVYLGPEGMLTGAARVAREARERAEIAIRDRTFERRRMALTRRRAALDAQIAVLRSAIESESIAFEEEMEDARLRDSLRAASRAEMARTRQVDLAPFDSLASEINRTRTPQ